MQNILQTAVLRVVCTRAWLVLPNMASKNNLLIGFEKYDTSIALCFQFRVILKLAFSQKVNIIDWFSRELSHRPKMTFEELVMRLLFTALISSNYLHPRVSFRAIHSK